MYKSLNLCLGSGIIVFGNFHKYVVHFSVDPFKFVY